MKTFLLLLLASVNGYVNLLYSQDNNRHIIVPVENEQVFFEGDQKFTYQAKDDVFVSIGFNSHRKDEYIFDMTIDNQSNDTLEFDPRKIHLFRYNQDTLAEKHIYYALDPELVLDSIDYAIDKKKDKIRNNTILSIFLGALFVTSEISGFNETIDFGTFEALCFTHEVAQAGLDVSRKNTGEKIYDLEFAGNYWLNGTLQKSVVFPHTYESGKIHFKVPQSEILKIYVPVDYRLYSYTFQDVVAIR